MPKHGKINFIRGFATSSGIVSGHAYVRMMNRSSSVPRTLISGDQIEAEIKRLDSARMEVHREFDIVRKKIVEYLGDPYSEIISAQQAILNDEGIVDEIRAYMNEHHVNVAYAYKYIMSQYLQSLDEVESEYFRERITDIRDVRDRVLGILLSKKSLFKVSELDKPTIMVAKDINPTDMVMLMTENVVGFITEFGGVTSHVSILARTLNIPMLVGVSNATTHISSGQLLILDADHGKVVIQPHKELEDEYDHKVRLLADKDIFYQRNKDNAAVTADGYKMLLSANISLSFEVDHVKKYGGNGIGLYRTEYLYMMKPTLPSESELFKDYRKCVEAFPDDIVTIRTIDVGGDKMASMWEQELRNESNPFMGYRAIRICLDKPDVFKTQVAAILRASAYGQVALMLPMITHLEELLEAKEHINDVKSDFKAKNISFSNDILIGIMIETPSAVINMDNYADHVDFFSIGTNDLTQYTLAVDRGNEKVSQVYCHYDPAVLKLIKMSADSAHRAHKPIYICGEMAVEKEALYFFAGLKISGISVSPRYLGPVREFIRQINQRNAEACINQIISCKKRDKIRNVLKDCINL